MSTYTKKHIEKVLTRIVTTLVSMRKHEIEEHELLDRHNELLNDCYESVVFMGGEYSPCSALFKLNPRQYEDDFQHFLAEQEAIGAIKQAVDDQGRYWYDKIAYDAELELKEVK